MARRFTVNRHKPCRGLCAARPGKDRARCSVPISSSICHRTVTPPSSSGHHLTL